MFSLWACGKKATFPFLGHTSARDDRVYSLTPGHEAGAE